MWSKLSSKFKADTTADPSQSTPKPPSATAASDVLGSVYNAHPNLSVFHQDTPPSDRSPSPPPSPKRLNMFKRASKLALAPSSSREEGEPSSSFKIALSVPKRVKASLQSASNEAHHVRPSVDTARPSNDALAIARPPNDSLRPAPTPLTPSAPLDARAGGSVRSILRDKHTPGTGRSVRFFPKDAYKFISPDASSTGSDMEFTTPAESHTFAASLTKSGAPPRLKSPPRSVFDLFPESTPAPRGEPPRPGTSMSLNSTVSNGDVSDFFRDIPVDQMPPVIGSGLALSDSAVELPDSEAEPGDAEDDTRRAPPNSAPLMAPPRPDMPRSTHDRSQSFSFGQTVFMSMGRSFSSSSEPAASKDAPPRAPGQFGIQPVFSRLRSQSETMLTRVPSEVSSNASADSLARAQNTSHYVSALGPRSPSFSSQDGSIAEASSGSIAVWTKPDPDPFAADAGTYYTAETRIAQTPPELDAMSQASAYFPGALSISGSRGPLASSESLSRTSSRDDSVLLALREQLAVQEQLARQTELDLAARDELVVALQERLGAANAEVDARRGAIRGWRKKVAELERACRHLEHQADHSARDSMDRSVLEEASSEALRMLHRRIDALETERRDAARDAAALREQLAKREADLAEHEEQNRLLRDGALSAQEPVSAENGGARGDEEKAPLAMDLQRLEHERELLEQEAQTLRDSVKELQDAAQRRARELEDLQTELEAQWKNTENASTAYDKLKAEKAAVEKDCGVLQENVVALEGRISSMETDWTDAENGRADLTGQLEEALAAREEVEHERDDLASQLQAEQAQIEELAHMLQEREDRITELTEESEYSKQTVSRLEENVRQRDAEMAEYTERLRRSESAADELRDELSALRREHARALEQRERELADAKTQAAEAQSHMTSALNTQARGAVHGRSLEERTGNLESELERYRRQVHELQQASADKDLKILQLNKQRGQDKEDLDGLNIALDSKQQELELLKRKVTARPSSTTIASTKAPNGRRDSTIAATSVVTDSRPPSSMSEVSTSSRHSETTTESISAARRPALAKSTRTSETAPESISAARRPTLAKSTRANSAPNTTSSAGGSASARKPASAATAGPPGAARSALAAKPRASVTSPPPRISSSNSATPVARRLAAIKPPPSTLPDLAASAAGRHRRVSSSLSSAASASGRSSVVTSPTLSEKENATPRRPVQAKSSVPA